MRPWALMIPAVVLTFACNPPAVDPNAEFTITGKLVGLSGATAADTDLFIYKVDSPLRKDSNFLQDTFFEQDSAIRDVYPAKTGEDGTFAVTLLGRDVNTESGGGAAYLSVVHFDQGVEGSYLATATSWYSFRDEDPVWDVGELKLWDGLSASQSGEVVTFSWSGPSAPAGNERVPGLPSFLFAWDANAANTTPTWADHSFQTSVSVPRAAFRNTAGSPEFFVTGFSQPVGGSQIYQHRSALHSQSHGGVANWSASLAQELGLALFEGGTDSPISDVAALDGNMDTDYVFAVGTRDLYIDLGIGGQAFTDILLHNLIVLVPHNALITVSYSTDDSASPGVFTPLASLTGEWEFDNWFYIGESTSITARWIRVSVDRRGQTGSYPELDSVGEVRVFQ